MSCAALTLKGRQCKKKPKTNSIYCGSHIKKITVQEEEPYIDIFSQNPSDDTDMAENSHVKVPHTCDLCFSEAEAIIKCSHNHVFCNECVKLYLTTGLDDGKALKDCPNECQGHLDMIDIFSLLGERYPKYQEINDIAHVASFATILNDFKICPFCCRYGIICSRIENIRCVSCEREWCSECNRTGHEGDCRIFTKNDSDDKIRQCIHDIISDGIGHKCPGCEVRYIRIGGCNKMTCPRCEAVSCYLCGTRILPKDTARGLDTYYHFQGQGASENDERCYLWGHDNVVKKRNMDKVIEVCRRILDMNSDIHIRTIVIREMNKYGVYLPGSEAYSYVKAGFFKRLFRLAI